MPRKIRTDNGPPFNGDEFKRYMEALGIELKTSTPLWPQANGNAESIMKPIGKVIKTATLLERKKIGDKNFKDFCLIIIQPRMAQRKSLHTSIVQSEVQGTLPEFTTKKVLDKHNEAKGEY